MIKRIYMVLLKDAFGYICHTFSKTNFLICECFFEIVILEKVKIREFIYRKTFGGTVDTNKSTNAHNMMHLNQTGNVLINVPLIDFFLFAGTDIFVNKQHPAGFLISFYIARESLLIHISPRSSNVSENPATPNQS